MLVLLNQEPSFISQSVIMIKAVKLSDNAPLKEHGEKIIMHLWQ